MIKVPLSTCSIFTLNCSTFYSTRSFTLQVKKFPYLWFKDSMKDDLTNYISFNVQGQISPSKISLFSTIINYRFHHEATSSVVHASLISLLDWIKILISFLQFLEHVRSSKLLVLHSSCLRLQSDSPLLTIQFLLIPDLKCWFLPSFNLFPSCN